MKQPPPELARALKASTFLAVDPGVRHPAVALFTNGTLVTASRVHVPSKISGMTKPLQQGERVRLIAGLIETFVASSGCFRPYAVVHEWPKAYSKGKSKNSADQLFHLSALGAAVAARFNVTAVSPQPFEWIGNIPKDDEAPSEEAWVSPRGVLVKSRLMAIEIARVVLSHDSVDATGIGLWALGRLAPRFVGAV